MVSLIFCPQSCEVLAKSPVRLNISVILSELFSGVLVIPDSFRLYATREGALENFCFKMGDLLWLLFIRDFRMMFAACLSKSDFGQLTGYDRPRSLSRLMKLD
jgi:hypothetical protein